MRVKTNNKGFTLVELIVVIAIIAILATVAVIGYNKFIDRANQSKVNQELAQAENVLRAEAVETVTVSLDDVFIVKDDVTVHPTLVMSLDGSQIKFTFTDAIPENVQDLLDKLIIKVGLKNEEKVELSTLKGDFTLIGNELKYTIGDAEASIIVIVTGVVVSD